MRLFTFLAGVAAGVALQQSLAAERAPSMRAPKTSRVDDTDTGGPGVGIELVGADGTPLAPVVAGVGVPGDGVRS
ncbi:hypothetical protein ASG30_05100 [Ramlibacter sp. Leaf400]|nr:hypothetical protein ASG30_05100 [Ramlibacter sp. Leaf400]